MGSGEWWNDTSSSDAVGDYDPTQTGTTQNSLDPNTTYSPPGSQAPIDQYNYSPNPAAAGGYDTFAPGEIAPINSAQFSNTSGQYPNDQDMSQSIANNYSQGATVDYTGAANMGGFNQLPAEEQQSWRDYYGDAMAQYAWGQQTGNYNVPAAAQGFNALDQQTQNLFYGTYGDQAPQVWAQQNAQNMMNQQGQSQLGNIASQIGQWIGTPGQGGQFNYGASMGQYPAWMGGGGTPANNPMSIGANTSEIPWGWGVGGFGQSPQRIDQSYLNVLNNPQLAAQLMPGYIPGSGTYNQRSLTTPGLIGNVAGVLSNMAYGSGGVGDPTTGKEVQTPEEWVQGGRLFNWQGNMQGDLGYIANLFGRSDTPSGIGTPTWSAPKQYWDGLAQQVAAGRVQPTARGWNALAAKGYTPQGIGGAAPQQAQSVGYTGGASSGGGTGPMGAGSEAFNYQQSYLAYLTARMNQLDIPGMQNQNQQFHDQLAFEQAKQKWLEQYQQQTLTEGQRQFNELQGLRQGELVGTYNGQQTLASRAEQNQTGLGYLNLLSRLRGPGDIFQYLKVLNGTPGGIRDLVNAASGAYRMPTTGGGASPQVTQGASLDTLLAQMNNPNYGQEAQNLQLPLPNQINALALQRMTPSQQRSLLAAYEAAGYNPDDVLAIFNNSMPQYAQQQGGVGRVNLWR